MDSSTSSSELPPRPTAALSDRATQVLLAAFLCVVLYAAWRPDLPHVVGKSDHDRFVAQKLLIEPHSVPVAICGNSRALFGIQCGRFDGTGLPAGAMNLAMPALRYTEPYLEFVDRTLATGGPRAVVLCLGERNFRATTRSVGFAFYEANGAALRAATPDALGRRFAALPIDPLAKAWLSGDLARLDADRRRRFAGGSFRVDGSALVDLQPGDPGEPHEAPPQDLGGAPETLDGEGGEPDLASLRSTAIDTPLAIALLESVKRWSASGVTVTYIRMPDSGERDEARGRKVTDADRTAAFGALGRALRAAGAVELRPSFEGLRTWDGVHMDGASAEIFTDRVAVELQRAMALRGGRPACPRDA